ncbi:MAG: ComEC family competence protein [Chitinophagaceae bacterium]|nr:ComEC family competence protein [Chitinophagaceae bacterium]
MAKTKGVLFLGLILAIGMFLTYNNNISKNSAWYGNHYQPEDFLLVRIDEPVIQKNKSYKADGYVEAIIRNDSVINTKGKLLLYFSKDSAAGLLHYGDKIIINKNLQPIKNSGNPGAFNYQRYAAFQQIFHNVFLKDKDWIITSDKRINRFKQFIYMGREKVLSALQKNIGNNKDELGIAEALLIGYTNDLDKDLVQAYSNTGVVHIIAISGMHLGLIYVMLVWLFGKLPGIRKSNLLQVVLILSCLWVFSLLTGASASVLRSAVMFSCIAIGKNFFKQASIYNSLAASAFILLCYNPYYLWDVGFQLSYLAVVGIIIFQKPIYNSIYIKNKYANEVWKLVAISIAAQLLTFPICIYYFHQFPNLFLLTNILAVPLSSLILYVEIALVAFGWIPYVGNVLGKLTQWLVWLMNKIILFVNDFSFAVWDKIPSTIATTLLLYAIVVGVCWWLIYKKKVYLKTALICLLAFVSLHSFLNWQIKNQQKLIVYNVPQHQAIDIIKGNQYQFVGDSILLIDGILQNFHLKPARIKLQLNDRTDSLPNCFYKNIFYLLDNKKVAILDEPLTFDSLANKINVDILIISKNPKLYIPQLASVFNCKQYVFDASNSLWKIERWKQDCERLNLQHYSIPEQGAFVLDL